MSGLFGEPVTAAVTASHVMRDHWRSAVIRKPQYSPDGWQVRVIAPHTWTNRVAVIHPDDPDPRMRAERGEAIR
ncbi:hypothetical protein [Streptomyces sp. NPDC050263]|uniref:hypothetical protein n=1 Tax=Streptomyces sp. NPDC050263 TaxID=3155037 RepID=UPI0034375D2B